MAMSIEMLLSCDAIYLLSNWRHSRGARIQRYIAEEKKIKLLFQCHEHLIENEIQPIKIAIKRVTGYAFEEYTTKCRKRVLLFPRMIFTWQVYRLGVASDEVISQLIQRDRCAVGYYVKHYPDEVKYNQEFASLASEVSRTLTELVSQ
jgi:hypothetical protein